jgi:SAM-dependent methyltransferase
VKRHSDKTPTGKTEQPDRDIKNWIDCYRTWTGPETGVQRIGSAGFWNRAWKERTTDRPKKPESEGRRKADNRATVILDLLGGSGFCVKNARILDIGCGPGPLALPLAKAGAKVTALDISSEALRYVREKAESGGNKIETIECSWWDADIDDLGLRNRFDLVIASMTPSIKDLETFNRMAECSKRYCYYSGSLPGGRNMALQEIYKTILGPDFPPKREGGPWFLYYFMYLYLNGYQPLVRIHHHRQRKDEEWEEAAGQAIRYVDRIKPCTTALQKKIRNYYQERSVDGKVPVRSDGYMGMMVWDKNVRQKSMP